MSYSPVPVAVPAALAQRQRIGLPAYLKTGDQRPRPTVITRRYEVTWLDAQGDVQTSTRLAPATPIFEETASAFARGTLIRTTAGLMAIEDLVPGMDLPVAEGGTRKLMWVGSMTLYPSRVAPDAEAPTLTRVMADAFGASRPMPDLLMGPRARILTRDARVRAFAGEAVAYAPARAFHDGDTAVSVTPIAPMAVYHIALDFHASVYAAGLEVESFHPGAGLAETIDPQMGGLYLSLFPHISSFDDFGPEAHPRLTLPQTEEMLAS
jgi:hypothetical protein